MYLLTFNVFTPNSTKNNFKCFSKAITVAPSIPSYDPTSPPNYLFKFIGDINQIGKLFSILKQFLNWFNLNFIRFNKDTGEVKANAYNFFVSHNVNVAGISVFSGSVYITFYSDDTSTTLYETLVASGLAIDPNLKYSYASINDNILLALTETTTTTAAPGLAQETVSFQLFSVSLSSSFEGTENKMLFKYFKIFHLLKIDNTFF